MKASITNAANLFGGTVGGGGAAERDELRMEELGGEGAGEGLDGGKLLRGEAGETLGGAGEFGLADRPRRSAAAQGWRGRSRGR